MDRNETLQSLYVLRAGLSLISQNKDEVEVLQRKSKTITEVMRLDRDIGAVDINADVPDNYFRKTAYLPSDRQVQIKICQDFLKEYAFRRHQMDLLENALECAYEYKKSKPAGVALGEYLKSEYEKNGVYDVVREMANRLYDIDHPAGKKKIRNIEKETAKRNKYLQKALDSVLEGTSKAFRPYVNILSVIIRDVTTSAECSVFFQFKYMMLKEKKRVEALPYYAEVEKSKAQLGSANAVWDQNQKLLKSKINESKNLFDVLYRNYNGLLPFSHWKNLDWVIYYVSEAYADTVKEALNLMLQQRQNDRVVQAISSMEKNVSATINRGVSSLKSTMQSGFESISVQLDEIDRKQAISDARLARLNHAADLSNVLAMRANLTSQRLADDLDYFRSLTE